MTEKRRFFSAEEKVFMLGNIWFPYNIAHLQVDDVIYRLARLLN